MKSWIISYKKDINQSYIDIYLMKIIKCPSNNATLTLNIHSKFKKLIYTYIYIYIL